MQKWFENCFLKDKRYLETQNIIFWEYKLSNQVIKVTQTVNDLFEVFVQLTSKRCLLFFLKR